MKFSVVIGLILSVITLGSCSGSDEPWLVNGDSQPRAVEEIPRPLKVKRLIYRNEPNPAINLFDAIEQNDFSVVQQYIEIGLDDVFLPPIYPDDWSFPENTLPGYPFAGASPLHFAIVVGDEKIVQLLIENGIKLEIKAKVHPHGTPLHWAAYFGKKSMTELLINSGAIINARDETGCTALCYTFLANQYVEQNENFNKDRESIQEFLESHGGAR